MYIHVSFGNISPFIDNSDVMFCPVQNSYFAIEITIDAMKYFCMLFSNICFDRSYFPISFAVVLIARGKNHCIIKHHEGKSLLTENTESQNNQIILPDCLANLDEMLIHQRLYRMQCSVYRIQYTVFIQYTYSRVQYTYSTHTVYCIHTWIVYPNSFLSPPLKFKLHLTWV